MKEDQPNAVIDQLFAQAIDKIDQEWTSFKKTGGCTDFTREIVDVRLWYNSTANAFRIMWTKTDELQERIKEEARQAVEELATVKLKLEEVEEKREQAERELTDARAIIKKTKREVERLRRQYNDRENEWGEKLHGELKKRGELLRDSESKFEALVK